MAQDTDPIIQECFAQRNVIGLLSGKLDRVAYERGQASTKAQHDVLQDVYLGGGIWTRLGKHWDAYHHAGGFVSPFAAADVDNAQQFVANMKAKYGIEP